MPMLKRVPSEHVSVTVVLAVAPAATVGSYGPNARVALPMRQTPVTDAVTANEPVAVAADTG
jgi:hypothetical protein